MASALQEQFDTERQKFEDRLEGLRDSQRQKTLHALDFLHARLRWLAPDVLQRLVDGGAQLRDMAALSQALDGQLEELDATFGQLSNLMKGAGLDIHRNLLVKLDLLCDAGEATPCLLSKLSAARP